MDIITTTGERRLPLSALESLGDGVVLANALGRMVFANRAAERILGKALAEGPPEQWGEHYGVFRPDGVTPFESDDYPLVRALRGDETDNVEMFVRNDSVPGGVLISVTGRPWRDVRGEIVGASVVFRDVTALRRTERELSWANQRLELALRREAELAAFVVHDLKSPLTSVLIGVSGLLARDDLPEDVRDRLFDVLESARSTQRMVLDLLDLHQAEDGALTPRLGSVDVSELLDEVRSAMHPRAADTSQQLAVRAERAATCVRADRELLRRVLQNLVDNCVKYGPKGGTIWIDALVPESSRLLLRVRDQGPGVPAALRERIFDKYALVERAGATRRGDSRGLGLSFCKLAVAVHGGRIWVEDNQPQGACFCVELPLAG